MHCEAEHMTLSITFYLYRVSCKLNIFFSFIDASCWQQVIQVFYYPYFFSHLLISFYIFHINHHRKEFIIVYSPGHVQLVFCIIKANICYISENALLVGLSWRANSALVSEDTNHRNTENIWKIGHKARYLFGLDSESKSDILALLWR